MQYVLHMNKMKSYSPFYSTTDKLVCLLLRCITQCIFCIGKCGDLKGFDKHTFLLSRTWMSDHITFHLPSRT